MKKLFCLFLAITLANCNSHKDKNDKGCVEKLPKGKYTIWNTGSRHIVKCLKHDGTIYWLNDSNFNQNGIDGYDAHQYHDKTQITIQ